jgi:hypothetical protein
MEPKIGDQVFVQGKILYINEGCATIAIYGSNECPPGFGETVVQIQCGALELNESPIISSSAPES